MNSKRKTNFQLCPCGTGKAYFDCCGIFISKQKNPSTPEELMRSRYTAYNQIDIDYIAHTMKSPAADNFDIENVRKWAEKITWLGLEIIKTTHNSTKGVVEFLAYYTIDGEKDVLHEISQFNFENGKWYYVSGVQSNKKIGRNDICPCGSTKKYKKCCGNHPK